MYYVRIYREGYGRGEGDTDKAWFTRKLKVLIKFNGNCTQFLFIG
jgi:hypothetical protein